MLKDITIGQHFPGNSVVHKMDPRLKIVLIIAYIVVLFMSTNIPGLLLCGVCAFSLYKVAKVPVKMLVKSIVNIPHMKKSCSVLILAVPILLMTADMYGLTALWLHRLPIVTAVGIIWITIQAINKQHY